jgi:hypothetical protein
MPLEWNETDAVDASALVWLGFSLGTNPARRR